MLMASTPMNMKNSQPVSSFSPVFNVNFATCSSDLHAGMYWIVKESSSPRGLNR